LGPFRLCIANRLALYRKPLFSGLFEVAADHRHRRLLRARRKRPRRRASEQRDEVAIPARQRGGRGFTNLL